MSLATEILWFTGKQRELSELQITYGMAQSDPERDELVRHQNRLIQSIGRRLKKQSTIYMRKKIIDKMIIQDFQEI